MNIAQPQTFQQFRFITWYENECPTVFRLSKMHFALKTKTFLDGHPKKRVLR